MTPPAERDANEDKEMSLVEHLDELRNRLIITIGAIVISTLVGFFISEWLLAGLLWPLQGLEREPEARTELTIRVQADGTLRLENPIAELDPRRLAQSRVIWTWEQPDGRGGTRTVEFRQGAPRTQNFVFSNPIDPFMMRMKAALLFGIGVSLPVILIQVWRFVAPGLRRNERNVIRPILTWSTLLFAIGAACAFGIVYMVLRVMDRYSVPNVEPLLNVFSYMSLLTTLMIVFGVVFELPLALALASRVGLVSPEDLARHRRHAYVIMAFASMLLTPADPISMIAALIPLVLLYEISIAVTRSMVRRRERAELDAEGVTD